MKQYTNKAFAIFASAMFVMSLLAVAAPAMAATLNDGSQDIPMVMVTNVTRNPDSNANWTTSVTADQGDVVAVEIYYHNTSASETINNLVVRLNQPTGTQSSFALTGSVSGDNASTVSGTATVNLSSGQTLTLRDIFWRPNQTVNGSQALPNGQAASQIFTSGLNLGSIGPGWSTQGNLIVRFTVGAGTTSQTPTVTTNNVTNLTDNAVTFNGNVNSNGNTNVTTYFEWGTTNPPSTQTSYQAFGNTSTSFTSTQTGLSPNTSYYVRAVAFGQNGARQYGSVVQFTTTGGQNYTQPTVQTYSATNVSQTDATLNGYVNANNNSNTSVWFEWGSDYNMTLRTNSQYVGNTSSNFNANLNGQLFANTTYYFRAVAQGQNGGIVRGTTLSFVTSGAQQLQQQNVSVSTLPATEIFSDSAKLNCSVSSNGSSNVNTWFEYGTTMSFGNQSPVTTLGYTTYSQCSRILLYLSPNTTYYFRAVAQNGNGTIVRGATLNFTTGYATVVQTPVTTTTYAALSGKGTVSKEIANLSFPNGTKTAIAARAGNTIEYTITVANTGSGSLTGATLRDRVPQYTTFVSASDNGSYNSNSGEVVWNLDSIASGESRKITMRVTANATNDNVVAENNARLTYGSSTTKISNTTIAIIHLTPLVLTMTSDRDRVAPGSLVNYSIAYKNEGKSALTGATLKLVLPAGIDFQSSDKAFTRGANTEYTLPVGGIDPEGQGTISVRALVGQNVEDGKALAASAVMSYDDAFLKKQVDVNTYSTVTVDKNAGSVSYAPAANGNSTNFATAGVAALSKSAFFPQTAFGWLGLILLIIVLVVLIKKNI